MGLLYFHSFSFNYPQGRTSALCRGFDPRGADVRRETLGKTRAASRALAAFCDTAIPRGMSGGGLPPFGIRGVPAFGKPPFGAAFRNGRDHIADGLLAAGWATACLRTGALPLCGGWGLLGWAAELLQSKLGYLWGRGFCAKAGLACLWGCGASRTACLADGGHGVCRKRSLRGGGAWRLLRSAAYGFCGRRGLQTPKTKQPSCGRDKKFHHHGQKNQSWNYGCIGLCRH